MIVIKLLGIAVAASLVCAYMGVFFEAGLKDMALMGIKAFGFIVLVGSFMYMLYLSGN